MDNVSRLAVPPGEVTAAPELPASFERFRNFHAGETILVCGCGSSLSGIDAPEQFITIGVNDVGRMFQPDYLVVLNSRHQFSGDRYQHVESSRARAVFSQLPLHVPHSRLIPVRLGRRGGTEIDGATLPYTRNSPYVAIALAMHMGARRIGFIGVDFTDNHFFGRTGRHPLSRELPQIDAEYRRLYEACAQSGIELYNLSAVSRLTGVPKISVAEFSAVVPRPALRIVSYATTPVAGVPPVLARCITARTANHCRTVWRDRHYGNGVSFDGDVEYQRDPRTAEELLAAADIVVLHNGKVAPQHERMLEGRAVLTLAHNYMWNVSGRFVERGYPGLVVGQYQASLPEFADWTAVPNPVPLWEPAYQQAVKEPPFTICYTPSGKHEAYPPTHRLYWHSKGYATTVAVLDRLAERYGLRLSVVRNRQVSHAESLEMKRRAHIVIDECVTGSYHRNSLEGLAAGAVVVNGLGIKPEIVEVLRKCTSPDAGNPFVFADLATLESTLTSLVEQRVDLLQARGEAGRRWMDEHWDFGKQWTRFWEPAVDQALARARRNRPAPAPAPAPPEIQDRRPALVAARRPLPTAPAVRSAAVLDDVSIVVPHGGAARLRNLTLVLQAIKTAAVVSDVIVVEMDQTPRAQALVKELGFRYVFAEQADAFNKPRAMNVGVPFVRSSRFFWIDSDLLVSAEFLRTAVAELEARTLDCLVPWTSVRYLSEEDSDAIAAGSRTASECTPVNAYYTRSGCRGGVSLVRTDFVRRYGGMCEEFHGWGGEDNAWFLKASVLGRAAATSRQDQHVYHVYHPGSGGYGPAVAIASNPHYESNLRLLHEVRRLTRRDRFLARFPPPAHGTPPWLGVRAVACAPDASAVGEILQTLYGPAVEIRADVEDAHLRIAASDLDGTTPVEVAWSVAARLALIRDAAAAPARTEIELPSEDPRLTLPLPWADNSVDAVRAHDVLGFLPDRIRTMNELWRILRNGGTAEIAVFTTDGPGAFAHPGSVTFWNRPGFDAFVHGHSARARIAERFGIVAAFTIDAEETQITPLGPRLMLTLRAVKGAT